MSSPLPILQRLIVLSLILMLCTEIFAAIPVSKTIYKSYPADNTKTIKIYDKTFTPAANAEILSFVVIEQEPYTNQEIIQRLIAIAQTLGGDAVWLYESPLFRNSKCIASIVREKDIQYSSSTVWVSNIDTVLKQQSQKFLPKYKNTKNQPPSATLSAAYGKGLCWDTNPTTSGDNWSFTYRRYSRSGFGLGLAYDIYSASYADKYSNYQMKKISTQYIGINCSWISVFLNNKLHYTADFGLGLKQSRWGSLYSRGDEDYTRTTAVASNLNIGLDYAFSENFAIGLNLDNMLVVHTILKESKYEYSPTRRIPYTKNTISVGLKFIFPR